MSEAEPRRSVRATKGQHTKSFDELEPSAAPRRRQAKKSKKAQLQEQEETETEEVIRCVCGATEQDEDSGEAWISCETCYVWQHNVCVGVSSFEDEIPDNYWCERCRPQDHKALLDGIAKGERPWEARRKAHEETEKKKRRGGRKPKGKRPSDSKDELDKSNPSPAPPDGVSKEPKESTPSAGRGKRRSREDSQDTDGKTPKLRRVSDQPDDAAAVAPPRARYSPPKDLATAISALPAARAGPAKAIKKSVAHVLTVMSKTGEYSAPDGETVETMAERYALQIERAVLDTHPHQASKGPKEYSQQIKSLAFNLKNNPEICRGLVHRQHSPTTLAVMTSEQLASAEMQRQDAEMRAKAEKASILYTSETGPRVRRTHKGEEVVEEEAMTAADVPLPMPGGGRGGGGGTPAAAEQQQHIKRESTTPRSPSSHQQHSPSQSNFDIGKVFSSVRSPSASSRPRRPSAPAIQTNGPGVDPDVDRMLEEDDESPPYSPTEESQDPDVIWRGSLAMSSIADFRATAKHIGGADFSVISSWSKLIPKRMTVAGRISQQSATEYLCSLRYSDITDVIVVSIAPESAEAQHGFRTLVDYFIRKERYGVVGDKVIGNVRDTYLIPVPAGEDNQPEFMLNLMDNFIPRTRTEPMLLGVFVYRNDPEQLSSFRRDKDASTAPAADSPVIPGGPFVQQRNNSMSGPGFSPATPQAQAVSPPMPMQSTTPVPIPQVPYSRPAAAPAQPQAVTVTTAKQHSSPDQLRFQAQKHGQALAEEVLGELIKVPTVQFLLPQAFQMSRREWEVIKLIYEQDGRARDDLQYLGALLEKRGAETAASGGASGGCNSKDGKDDNNNNNSNDSNSNNNSSSGNSGGTRDDEARRAVA